MTHSSILSDLIDLNEVLELDSSGDLDERKRRDRGIGQKLRHDKKRPAAQVRGWLHYVGIPGAKRNGQQGAQLYHVLCLLLIVAGLATGWGLTRAVLYYDGARPINIVNALGLLVLPQILLLLFWLLATVPKKLPLFSGLQSALRVLNPGRLARHAARLFPQQSRGSLAIIWDPENAAALAPAARWLFSFWSQLFSFSFNIGVLLAAFYLIFFSDLAFAWSTTLNISNAAFQRALDTLSWPWAAIYPESVPTAELVESSRYYRLEEGSLGDRATLSELAIRLGQWWPFLIAAIICYGLLPRMLTLIISWFRFRHHLSEALYRMPGATELLARMNSPLVSTSALQPETVAEIDAGIEPAGLATGSDTVKCAVIDWSGAGNTREFASAQLRALGVEPLEFFRAGGSQSTTQDNDITVALCKLKPEGVAVVVKSWEPPLLEFLDFLRTLRQQCARRQPIIVLLWGDHESVPDRDRQTWHTTLRQLHDPDLHIEVLGHP